MPLTIGHEEFIASVIDHLFDLPSERDALETATFKLQKAFEHGITDKTDEPYISLQNCISDPQNYFFGLENQDQNVSPTIGEVQCYILEIAKTKLKEKATELGTESKSEGAIKLEEEPILKLLQASSNFDANFVSTKQHNEVDLYEPSIAEPVVDRLFTKTMMIDTDFLMFRSKIEIQIPPNDPIIQFFDFEEDDINAFETDEERNNYLVKSLGSIAEIKAIGETANIAFAHFLESKTITAGEAKNASFNAMTLSTYTLYFNLIKNKTCAFSDISRLTRKETANLTSPSIINIISAGLSTVAIAKNISPQLVSSPYYYKRIHDHTLELKELMHTTKNQDNNLTSPNVTQLLHLNIMTLTDAKKMTTNARKLLENEVYFNLVKNNALDIKKILNISLEKKQNLSTLIISHFINNKILTIEEVFTLEISDKQRKVLNNRFVLMLLQINKIDLLFILSLSDAQCDNLAIPAIGYAILKEQITLEAAGALRLTSVCSEFLYTDLCVELMQKRDLTLEKILHAENYCDVFFKPNVIESLKSQKVNPTKFLKQLQNPLLLYLIRSELMEADEIHYILRKESPSAIEEFKGSDNTKKNRALMKEFVRAAKQGLLFEEDLLEIHNNLSKIPYTSEEKSTPNHLLKIFNLKSVRQACINNIYDRLTAIDNEEPFLLHGNKKDTLETITANMNNLKINAVNVWAYLYRLRLTGVYQEFPYKIHGKSDTIQAIHQDMQATISAMHFTPKELHNKTAKYLMNGILKDINSRLEWDTSKSLKVFFSSITDILNKNIDKGWPITLAEIYTFANKIRNTHTVLSLTLFGAAPYIKQRCGALCQIIEGLGYLQPLENTKTIDLRHNA